MIWSFICEIFGITPSISIGLNKEATEETRHGVANVRDLSGGDVMSIPFVVDKPKKLDHPTFFLIDSMYEQILKMGYEPVSLQFTNATDFLIFQCGRVRPTVKQRRTDLALA